MSYVARFRRTRPGPEAPGAAGAKGAPEGRPVEVGASPARRPRRRRWVVPGSPDERQAPVDPPAPKQYPCPFCGQVHQPVPLGGRGLADAYSRVLLPQPRASRPGPLGRSPDADVSALARDSAGAWAWGRRRALVSEPPRAVGLLERVRGWWQGPHP